MAAEIFTDEWAREWGDNVNENEAYRKAAANWEGAIVLHMTADSSFGITEDRAVIADLWHGECRSANATSDEDLDTAPYVIQATPAAWKDVLGGDLEPIFGLMRGKLKLARGGIFCFFIPYAAAAKELVRSASEVNTSFPEGWG